MVLVGRVVDEATGAGIADAVVTMDSIVVARSDSDGQLLARGVTSGMHSFVLHHSRFDTLSLPGFSIGGQDTVRFHLRMRTSSAEEKSRRDSTANLCVRGFCESVTERELSAPLLVVDGVVQPRGTSELPATASVLDVRMLSREEGNEKYGSRGARGVLEIVTLPRSPGAKDGRR